MNYRLINKSFTPLCLPLVSQPSCHLLHQSASSASGHWWHSDHLKSNTTREWVCVCQCAEEGLNSGLVLCINNDTEKNDYSNADQYCKRSSECWAISHLHAGGTELPGPQWRHWPASHKWSWQDKNIYQWFKKKWKKNKQTRKPPIIKRRLKNKKQSAVMLKLTCTCWKPPWLVSTPAAQTPPFQSGMQCRPEITPQPMMRSSSIHSLTTLHQQ